MAHRPPSVMDKYRYLVDVDTVTRDDIVTLLRQLEPGGTGELTFLKYSCGFLCQIAILKGFNPITPDEVRSIR